MPGGDGTGSRRGPRPGFGGHRFGAPGKCRCPSCGFEVAHRRRVPCMRMKCPKCGSSMIRGD